MNALLIGTGFEDQDRQGSLKFLLIQNMYYHVTCFKKGLLTLSTCCCLDLGQDILLLQWIG